MALVGIGDKAPTAKPPAPLFFFFGASAGFFGVAYIGVHLWLWRSGLFTPPASYAFQRYLHALIQLYLYFALFILGFLIQTGPRLFERNPFPRRIRFVLPAVMVASVAWAAIDPEVLLPRLLLSASFLIPLAHLAPGFRSSLIARALALPIATCLLTFATGAFVDVSNPLIAVIMLWGGVGGAVFGAGQQFIAGPMRGVRLAGIARIAFSILFPGSIAAGVAASTNFSLWPLFGLLMACTMATFAGATQMYRIIPLLKTELLAPYFVMGFAWALIAIGVLMAGPAYADASLHLFATGWGMALIFGIGTRIMSMATGGTLISLRTTLIFALLWQVVPLGRGLSAWLPQWFAWITATVGGGVYSVWLGIIAYRLIRKRDLWL